MLSTSGPRTRLYTLNPGFHHAGAPAPSLGAPPGSPAHLAGLVELLPREHRAAVGRLLTRDTDAPPLTP